MYLHCDNVLMFLNFKSVAPIYICLSMAFTLLIFFSTVTRLDWKPLLRRRKAHHAIFMYKLINNHFYHSIPVTFNGDFCH